MASKNIATYHPGTEMTLQDNMNNKIDYTQRQKIGYPYNQFDEASPANVSVRIDKNLATFIHERTNVAWAGAQQLATVSRNMLSKPAEEYSKTEEKRISP